MPQSHLTEPEVFVLAELALKKVVDQIKDDQWDMIMPDSFMMRDKQKVTLRTVINYHAYDDIWVPEMLASKTMDEVGKTKYDGDLLGNEPKKAFADIVEKAIAAAKKLSPEDLQKTAHLSFGDYTIQEYFWQINMYRALRAHDIAKVIGVDSSIPEELVQGIWEEISTHAEEWRKIGVFGPATPVAADASLMDRLLAITGRDIE